MSISRTFFFHLDFQDWVSFCFSGYPETGSVGQSCLKLTEICLALPSGLKVTMPGLPFLERLLLWRHGWPATHYIHYANLELSKNLALVFLVFWSMHQHSQIQVHTFADAFKALDDLAHSVLVSSFVSPPHCPCKTYIFTANPLPSVLAHAPCFPSAYTTIISITYHQILAVCWHRLHRKTRRSKLRLSQMSTRQLQFGQKTYTSNPPSGDWIDRCPQV